MIEVIGQLAALGCGVFAGYCFGRAHELCRLRRVECTEHRWGDWSTSGFDWQRRRCRVCGFTEEREL